MSMYSDNQDACVRGRKWLEVCNHRSVGPLPKVIPFRHTLNEREWETKNGKKAQEGMRNL
jgi:hypothetical protein